jgi:hypothetical protein
MPEQVPEGDICPAQRPYDWIDAVGLGENGIGNSRLEHASGYERIDNVFV